MVLQSSGRITLGDVSGEFGGTVPHKLSEYFGAATGIPGSGTIRLSNFYGKSNNPLPPTWITGQVLGYFYISRYQRTLTATSDSSVTYSVVSKSTQLIVYSLSSAGVLDFFCNIAPPGQLQVRVRATDQENQSTEKTFLLYIGVRATWNTAYRLYDGTVYYGTNQQIPKVFLGSFRAGSYVYIDLRNYMVISQYDSVSFNIAPFLTVNNLNYNLGVLSGTLSTFPYSGWGITLNAFLITSRFENGTGEYVVRSYDGSNTVFLTFNTY